MSDNIPALLLAETNSTWQSLVRNLHLEDGHRWSLAVAGIGLAVIAALLFWACRRLAWGRAGKRSFHSHKKLFKALCQAHGLDGSSRRLLWRLAASGGLKQPGSLFVEPERFEAAQLPADLRRREAHLTELRKKLFGASEFDEDEAKYAGPSGLTINNDRRLSPP